MNNFFCELNSSPEQDSACIDVRNYYYILNNEIQAAAELELPLHRRFRKQPGLAPSGRTPAPFPQGFTIHRNIEPLKPTDSGSSAGVHCSPESCAHDNIDKRTVVTYGRPIVYLYRCESQYSGAERALVATRNYYCSVPPWHHLGLLILCQSSHTVMRFQVVLERFLTACDME